MWLNVSLHIIFFLIINLINYNFKSLKFSEITVESLGELNGAQIFTLNKDELRQVLGCDRYDSL